MLVSLNQFLVKLNITSNTHEPKELCSLLLCLFFSNKNREELTTGRLFSQANYNHNENRPK